VQNTSESQPVHRISTIGYQCIPTAFHEREIVAIVYRLDALNAEGIWQTRRFAVKHIGNVWDAWELWDIEPRTQYAVRGMN
jgi:hypothetical protein